MNLWRSNGIVIVAGACVALLAVRALLAERHRDAKPPEPGVKVGSYKDLVKEIQGSSGAPQPAQKRELECAKRFALENAQAEMEAEQARATQARSPSEAKASGAAAAHESIEEFMRKQRERDAMLDRLPLGELFRQSRPDELDYALMRRIWAKQERDGSRSLTKAERTLATLSLMKGEVDNGGFHQFFFNSSGDRSLEALSAAREIDAKPIIAIYECALSAFPESRPSEHRATRNRQLAAWGDDQFGVFEPLDSAFYRTSEQLEQASLAFIRAHESEFELPPVR